MVVVAIGKCSDSRKNEMGRIVTKFDESDGSIDGHGGGGRGARDGAVEVLTAVEVRVTWQLRCLRYLGGTRQLWWCLLRSGAHW